MKLRPKKVFRLEALALVAGLMVAMAPSLANAQDGAAFYKAKCATCHGPDGSGNTAVGKSLKVADLRSAEVQKKSDADLAQSIAEGKGNMPGFKSTATEDEIHAVVMFVRTLASKDDPPSKKKSSR
jgi:mono/diheme cytochrome c family protein